MQDLAAGNYKWDRIAHGFVGVGTMLLGMLVFFGLMLLVGLSQSDGPAPMWVGLIFGIALITIGACNLVLLAWASDGYWAYRQKWRHAQSSRPFGEVMSEGLKLVAIGAPVVLLAKSTGLIGPLASAGIVGLAFYELTIASIWFEKRWPDAF